MAYQIQIRRDTAANWTATNPTLADGEWGYESDTKKFKLGDGSTAWTSLGYWTASSSTPGFLSAADWTTFNGKQATLVAADATHNGYLTSANWTTFNAKLSDAPSDGSQYCRQSGAWAVVTGGAGGGADLLEVQVFS